MVEIVPSGSVTEVFSASNSIGRLSTSQTTVFQMSFVAKSSDLPFAMFVPLTRLVNGGLVQSSYTGPIALQVRAPNPVIRPVDPVPSIMNECRRNGLTAR